LSASCDSLLRSFRSCGYSIKSDNQPAIGSAEELTQLKNDLESAGVWNDLRVISTQETPASKADFFSNELFMAKEETTSSDLIGTSAAQYGLTKLSCIVLINIERLRDIDLHVNVDARLLSAGGMDLLDLLTDTESTKELPLLCTAVNMDMSLMAGDAL
jgi:hypothetical protein